ncbi:cysteine-rich receptor-like protein kinase 8 [Tanacetum coccineum]
MRGTFRKGVICGNCNKEGHTKEECYKIVGYPVGHPLHGKYRPPNQTPMNNGQDSHGGRTINMAMTQGSTYDVPIAGGSSDAAMTARMDQLQNQLNQMILMMHNNKEKTGVPFMSNEGKPKLIASHISKSYRFIASHINARTYKVIASIMINLRFLWVVDSGAVTPPKSQQRSGIPLWGATS